MSNNHDPLRRWMPLILSIITFATVFSAGPLLFPDRLIKMDGRPDKKKWALAAGGGAAAALAGTYAVQAFI